MFEGSDILMVTRGNFYRLMPETWLDNTVIDRSIAICGLSHEDYLDIIEKSLLDEAKQRKLEDIVDLAT
eukprot:gene19933-28220_t